MLILKLVGKGVDGPRQNHQGNYCEPECGSDILAIHNRYYYWMIYYGNQINIDLRYNNNKLGLDMSLLNCC